MTYLRALSDEYISWRSQALIYLTAFVTATGLAITLEHWTRITLTEVLLFTSLWTFSVVFGLPALKSIFVNSFHVPDQRTDIVLAKAIEEQRGARLSRHQQDVLEDYEFYTRQIPNVLEELSRSNVAPQTKMVLLRLLYLLMETDRQRSPDDLSKANLYTNQGMYTTLIPIYRELEEILLSIGIKSYGRIQQRLTQQRSVQEQQET